MPNTILEVNITDASIGGPSEVDSETSLSTSSTNRLSKTFPDGPQHTDAVGPSGPGSYTLGRTKYRKYYETVVLGGNNLLYQAKSLNGTYHDRNYIQNGPPNLSSLDIDDKTIVSNGLGPNVNVADAMELVGWSVTQGTAAPLEGSADDYEYGIESLDPTKSIIDPTLNSPSSVPFVGDGTMSPSDTSIASSASSLHLLPPGDSKLYHDGE
jgi:hypothetical protein